MKTIVILIASLMLMGCKVDLAQCQRAQSSLGTFKGKNIDIIGFDVSNEALSREELMRMANAGGSFIKVLRKHYDIRFVTDKKDFRQDDETLAVIIILYKQYVDPNSSEYKEHRVVFERVSTPLNAPGGSYPYSLIKRSRERWCKKGDNLQCLHLSPHNPDNDEIKGWGEMSSRYVNVPGYLVYKNNRLTTSRCFLKDYQRARDMHLYQNQITECLARSFGYNGQTSSEIFSSDTDLFALRNFFVISAKPRPSELPTSPENVEKTMACIMARKD